MKLELIALGFIMIFIAAFAYLSLPMLVQAETMSGAEQTIKRRTQYPS
jgi:hypothetical protein